ncbi:pyruvate, water dikinase [Desulfosporosinus hippei DSM 8344]|uniref:Pyruvate, water dikinase n=1 Tax=Desulfosporosinus hippei DSM 8344 TaxID=1121419 RepID=A0A1G7VSD6_9FIRM|nr:pyruvate, water dikinase [Desulfosporosinus hippei DSM 8344]
MMTDPLKPLGMYIFQLTSFGPKFAAGGRMFVDVTPLLASPDSRKTLLKTMGEHDPLMKDALMTIVERGDFIKPLASDQTEVPGKSKKGISSAGSPANALNF